MSLGFGRSARRRQRRSRLLKSLPIVGGVVALGIFSYVSGSELALHEVSKLRTRLNQLTQRLATNQEENSKLRAEKELVQTRETEWRRRYEKDAPTGVTKNLLSLIRTQLARNVAPDRLAFMIGAAANTESCRGQPITKRFLVRTPIHGGESDSVGFADNAITVSAEGPSATNSAGNPEAWFDPAKRLTVQFTRLGGVKGSHVFGLLPLHHKLVTNNVEYRFSIVKGVRRGFVKVTGARCPLSKGAVDPPKRINAATPRR